MLISQKWLKEYVDYDYNPEDLDRILTMLGVEVEAINYPAQQYDNFFIGKVLDKQKHPSADKLSICKVDYGDGEKTIICGAPNVDIGQIVVVGAIGAKVPSAGFQIEKRAIRGIESEGMICSENELLLGDDSAGIWVLPENAPVGMALAKWLDIDDVIFEISLTPNRADCLSHIGIAREIAAYKGTKIKKPIIEINDTSGDINDSIEIVVENAEKCPRYSTRVIRDAKIGESPEWLKKRLTAVGLRPLNIAVDVTNFVLMECGQPLHAFDLDKISAAKIIVKTAIDKEKFTTLDSKERTLDSEMLMICSSDQSIAIGGVMGGENSEISSDTKNILLESAYFSPKSIRRTAKKLGISSEASHRFERGVDPENVLWALDRAAFLIAELSGGKVEAGIIDVYPQRISFPNIALRYDKARQIIGADISNSEMIDMLSRLDFQIIEEDQSKVLVKSPSYRVDMESEIDLIEEVARLFNYDNIQPKYTSIVDYQSEQLPDELSPPALREKLRNYLIPNGFAETLNQNMTSPSLASYFTDNPVVIANPLGEEISVLRPSLAMSMLKAVEWNLRFGNKDLRLFEIGKIFLNTDDNRGSYLPGIVEKSNLIICISGKADPMNWASNKRSVDFYDIKGVATDLLEYFRLPNIKISALKGDNPIFSLNSQTIEIHNTYAGCYGEVRNDVLKKFDIDQDVFLLEFDLSVLNKVKVQSARYTPLPLFPSITRDLAFVVDLDIEAEVLLNEIKQNGGSLMQNAEVFDLYTGKSIEKGKKSIAFTMSFSSPERTLVDTDVEDSVNTIINAIETKFSALLRKF